MSDESFIREVEEELRSDKLQSFWSKYGKIIIGLAIAIVVFTAGYRYWLTYTDQVAGASGDRFIEAVELSNENKHDEAIAALEKLSQDGHGQYPALATIRLAAEFAKKGDTQKAISAFDSIANDTGFDETLRNVARLRSGLLLVDNGTYDEVADRLQQMAATGLAFRHSAREGLGLSAWKNKQHEDALKWFTEINADQETPSGIRTRAAIILELLAGIGIKSEEESQG